MLRDLGDRNILGKLIKRQGASKSTTEIDDISTALTNLAEKEVLPLCIGTSNMVMQTPSFNVHCEEANIGAVVDRMKCLEESIDSFVEKNSAQIDLVSNNYEKIISNTNIENRRIDAIINKLKTIEHNYCETKTKSNNKRVELKRDAIPEMTATNSSDIIVHKLIQLRHGQI